MKQNKILDFISERYKNFSSVPYEEIIGMCEVGQPLHGVRNDTIGNPSDSLFFIGQKKGSPKTESVFEYSKIDHKINVLGFCYLKAFPRKKIASGNHHLHSSKTIFCC